MDDDFYFLCVDKYSLNRFARILCLSMWLRSSSVLRFNLSKVISSPSALSLALSRFSFLIFSIHLLIMLHPLLLHHQLLHL